MTETELDEILTLRWPAVIRAAVASGDRWAEGFAKSIARQARRKSWQPSNKQAAHMRRLLRELRTSEPELIEE